MKRSSLSLFLASALVGVSFSAHALQPLVTDDTGTQGMGGNQLEFSYNYDRSKTDGDSDRAHGFPVTYTYGLTDTIDIGVGIEYDRIKSGGVSNSGLTNTVIGAKWRFYESEATGTSFAIKPELILPVSSQKELEGLGVGEASGNLTFIMTQEVPFGAVHVNAGLGRDRFKSNEENADTTYKRFSVAPVWDVTSQWKLAADVGVEAAKAAGTTVTTRFIEVGAIYAANKDVDLAVGITRARDNAETRTDTNSFTMGVTWRF